MKADCSDLMTKNGTVSMADLGRQAEQFRHALEGDKRFIRRGASRPEQIVGAGLPATQLRVIGNVAPRILDCIAIFRAGQHCAKALNSAPPAIVEGGSMALPNANPLAS